MQRRGSHFLHRQTDDRKMLLDGDERRDSQTPRFQNIKAHYHDLPFHDQN